MNQYFFTLYCIVVSTILLLTTGDYSSLGIIIINVGQLIHLLCTNKLDPDLVNWSLTVVLINFGFKIMFVSYIYAIIIPITVEALYWGLLYTGQYKTVTYITNMVSIFVFIIYQVVIRMPNMVGYMYYSIKIIQMILVKMPHLVKYLITPLIVCQCVPIVVVDNPVLIYEVFNTYAIQCMLFILSVDLIKNTSV